MDGWMGGWMDGWMEGRMDGWKDGWMEGWMDGRVDGRQADWKRGNKAISIYKWFGHIYKRSPKQSTKEISELINKLCRQCSHN